VATVVSRNYLGDTPAFLTPGYELKSLWSYPMYVVLGFLAAMVAYLFTKTLYKTEDIFDKIKIPEYVKPAIGGLMIGVIGLYFPQIFGVGYETIEIALSQSMGLKLALTLLVLKMLATSLSLGSGGSGGVFAPSLFLGAMLGVAFSYVVQMIMPDVTISPGAYALLGMGAVFAGAAQAPISAILILFEMTGNYKIILPLITVCIISAFLVRRWSEFSIYTLKIKRKGININKLTTINLLEDLLVGDSMSTDVITLLPNNTIKEAGLQIKKTHHRGFPVINKQHILVGIITYNDINKYLREKKGETHVSEVMSHDLIKCYTDENLRMALEKMGGKDIGRIPVVEYEKQDTLLGIITRKNIITACNKAIRKRHLEIFEKDSTIGKNISKLFY
jgi:CIC family chloride channel protein